MKTDSIVLGGGCFWCLEAAYQLVEGVSSVVSGYAGGDDQDPTYDTVCSGVTGHAEVVRVVFDPSIIDLQTILKVFWTIHDPTTRNQQGADIGTQYRSIILYNSPQQKDIITDSIHFATALWDDHIVTEVAPLTAFYEAEEYHQNYFANHPEQGYCQAVIQPKLFKLRKELSHLLRTS